MSKNKASDKRKAIVEAISKNALTARRTDSMIRRITLRDVATFRHEGVTLDDLQRVNFIYGGNGCGKTTLSRVLANSAKYKTCEIEWTEMPLKVLVYNKDFRDNNLCENIPGVFTLGKDSVDAEKQLERLQSALEAENQNLKLKHKRIEARGTQIDRDTTRLRDALWNDVLLPESEYFTECLGEQTVTSKAQFARQITAKVENGEYRKAPSREGLLERYGTLYGGENLTVITPLKKQVTEYKELIAITANPIWGSSAGLNLQEEEVCPLCGQTIVNEEAQKLRERYKKEIEQIRNLANSYQEKALQLQEMLHVIVLQCTEMQDVAGKHVEILWMKLELLNERIDTNHRNPSKHIDEERG